jgi:DNA-binding IclR family transcriptional regulator
MSGATLPDDVRRFVLTSVPSVPYIESLLLLRLEAASTWTASQLAKRIYVPAAQAASLLDALESAGSAVRTSANESAYRYQPPPDMHELLDRLAAHYARDLLAVTDLIHSSLNRRANQFADAFRWRKDS